MIISGLLKKLGESIFNEMCDNYGENFKKAAFNTITDSIESALVGERTVEEWAEIVIEVVDKIKNNTIRENGYKYLGGKLKFSLSSITQSKVIISYELYFLDDNGNYMKNSAKSDVNKNNFTQESLDAIAENGEIAYEVEE